MAVSLVCRIFCGFIEVVERGGFEKLTQPLKELPQAAIF
jgi:hypothetical protein